MVRDAEEHICSGCYEVIASHDPEAYKIGGFYYHSKAHEKWHASRRSTAAHAADAKSALKMIQAPTVHP